VSLIKTAAGMLRRRALRADNRQLLMLSGLLSLAGLARARAKQPPKLLHTEVLEPGEAVRVTVIDPATER